jgi:hypothetical protein
VRKEVARELNRRLEQEIFKMIRAQMPVNIIVRRGRRVYASIGFRIQQAHSLSLTPRRQSALQFFNPTIRVFAFDPHPSVRRDTKEFAKNSPCR